MCHEQLWIIITGEEFIRYSAISKISLYSPNNRSQTKRTDIEKKKIYSKELPLGWFSLGKVALTLNLQ